MDESDAEAPSPVPVMVFIRASYGMAFLHK